MAALAHRQTACCDLATRSGRKREGQSKRRFARRGQSPSHLVREHGGIGPRNRGALLLRCTSRPQKTQALQVRRTRRHDFSSSLCAVAGTLESSMKRAPARRCKGCQGRRSRNAADSRGFFRARRSRRLRLTATELRIDVLLVRRHSLRRSRWRHPISLMGS